ncbi:hypothetical protein BGZ94_006374 [Podila epigama]|nr:hypothetical protein BGZ94_006374 [Podila epigama]
MARYPHPPSHSQHAPHTKRHHPESDSEAYSDHDMGDGPRGIPSYPSYENNKGAPVPPNFPNSSVPGMHEALPQLAPRPPYRHTAPPEDSSLSSSYQQRPPAQRQPNPSVRFLTRNEGGSTIEGAGHGMVSNTAAHSPPFRIQSARGTPKGPLPIEVQISLLSSVLKHDPFNCAIRKTTQAWELISREQGIRARTCSRRFDNIIQASIAGRDRPMGTEEQILTKKKLLEKLFEMMNQPQALMRMQKKRRYRSEEADRQLLLETIRLNPFGQKVGQVAKAWEDVRDALKMKVHARQCIRRVNRMVKPYQLRERMYKGTIPDEMKEANDDLVKQVIHLMRQAGGGSLDDACNSNASSPEDSGSGMSDSDDQDEGYMDHDEKQQQQQQQQQDGGAAIEENDELDEDDDHDMGTSEKRRQFTANSNSSGHINADSAGASGKERGNVSLSPVTQGGASPTRPETPSMSGIMSTSARSSTPTPLPAKRGRPRNSSLLPQASISHHMRQGSVERQKPGSGLKMEPPVDASMRDYSSDKARHHPHHYHHDSSAPRQRGWESEPNGGQQRLAGSFPSEGGSYHAGRPAGLPSPSPSLYPARNPGYSGHPDSVGAPSEQGYPGPSRSSPGHSSSGARTSPLASYGGHPHSQSYPGHPNTASSSSAGAGAREHRESGEYQRPVKHARTHSKGHRDIAMDTAHRPETQQRYGDRPYDSRYEPVSPSALQGPPPTTQQYHELVMELHKMRDTLVQMDEQQRVSLDKQGAMFYTIETLQQQIHRQQQEITQLQQQLRYGYGPEQQQASQRLSGPPPPSASGGGVSTSMAPPTTSSSMQGSQTQHHHHQHHQHSSHHGYHKAPSTSQAANGNALYPLYL